MYMCCYSGMSRTISTPAVSHSSHLHLARSPSFAASSRARHPRWHFFPLRRYQPHARDARLEPAPSATGASLARCHTPQRACPRRYGTFCGSRGSIRFSSRPCSRRRSPRRSRRFRRAPRPRSTGRRRGRRGPRPARFSRTTTRARSRRRAAQFSCGSRVLMRPAGSSTRRSGRPLAGATCASFRGWWRIILSRSKGSRIRASRL